MEIGDRVIIVAAAGSEFKPGLKRADPYPEHINKKGVITGIADLGGGFTTPVITLDDGNMLYGSECWWMEVK